MTRRCLTGPLLASLILLTGVVGTGTAFAQSTAGVAINHAASSAAACSSTTQPYGYQPARAQVDPGGTVTFSNPSVHANGCGADAHPTRCIEEGRSPSDAPGSTKGACSWTSFTMDAGESAQVTFPAEGTFVYQCLKHPYMYGTIVVGDGDPGTAPSPPPSPPRSPPPPPPTAPPPPSPSAPAPPSPSSPPSSPASSSPPTPQSPPTPPSPGAVAPPVSGATPTTDAPRDDASPGASASDDATDPPSGAGAPADRGPGGDARIKVLATLLVAATAGGTLWARRRVA